MRVPLFALAIAAAMLLPSWPAQAHHSFGGTYNVDKEITIKGKMVEVSLRSPHSFFYVEMLDAKGTAQRWAIEGGSAVQFAGQFAQGGTILIPGHGWLSDAGDVGYYRDMMMIIRDRVQNMIDKGMTLAQVKAAKPTMDYDPEYGREPGVTARFVEAVYRSLREKKTK